MEFHGGCHVDTAKCAVQRRAGIEWFYDAAGSSTLAVPAADSKAILHHHCLIVFTVDIEREFVVCAIVRT